MLITAESKGIPLVYEMARQNRENRYLIARKAPKLYMRNVFSTEVTSITTVNRQMLFIDQNDVDFMRGKRVLIVDDVISTGESLKRRKAGVRSRRHRRWQDGHPGRRAGQRPGRHPVPGIPAPL